MDRMCREGTWEDPFLTKKRSVAEVLLGGLLFMLGLLLVAASPLFQNDPNAGYDKDRP